MIGVIILLIAFLSFGVLSNSISVLAVSLIVTLVAYKFPNLHKKATYFYILAILVSAASIYFYEESFTYLVNKGLIAYGFIVVVMFVGALPNKWGVTRAIKKNRGVFSILAFLLITPHATLRVLGIVSVVNLWGVAAYVIMIPLTIISFRVIRREINPKDWFKIQKAAYVIYGLLFIHLWMMSFGDDTVVYSVIMALYVNNKLIKEYKKREAR